MSGTSALIIFDIDGTLFETHRVTVPAVQRTFAAFGLAVPDAAAISYFTGRPVEEYYAWLEAQCPAETARRIVAETDRLELELIAAEGRLYDGMGQTLDTLLQTGHVLAVCSNAPDDYMHQFLDAHRMRPYFREVRCRGTRPTDKTAMVAELMACIAVRPVVVIGDRRDDIEAAHANGTWAIGAAYGFGDVAELADADVLVHAPSEVPQAVRALLDAGSNTSRP